MSLVLISLCPLRALQAKPLRVHAVIGSRDRQQIDDYCLIGLLLKTNLIAGELSPLCPMLVLRSSLNGVLVRHSVTVIR